MDAAIDRVFILSPQDVIPHFSRIGIGEVLFHANGSFGVTWLPFEVYQDYWGSYSFDLDSGTVELTIDTGNYIPDDVDLQGTFAIDSEGRLVLQNLWLGSSYGATSTPACGHRLIGGFASDGTSEE